MKITFVNGVPTQASKSDDEEVTYHPEINEDDDSDYDQEGSDVEYNYIQLTPSNYISVVRCAFSQEKNDWRRTAFFHTIIKIGDKNWKVIVNNENYVNVVSSKMIEKIGWKAEPHSIYISCHGSTRWP